MGKIRKNMKIKFWDCKHCEHQGIPGAKVDGKKVIGITKCPNCGASRDADVEFYHTKESHRTVYNAPNLLEQVVDNPDWECEYCGTANPKESNSCQNCGDDRQGNEERNKVKVDSGITREPASPYPDEPEVNHLEGYGDAPETNKEGGFGELFVEGNEHGGYDINPSHDTSPSNQPPQPPFNYRRLWVILGSIAGVLLVALLIWGLLPHSVDVKVTGHSWERVIDLEKYIECHESTFGTAPTGSYNHEKKWEDTGETEEVFDHYKDVEVVDYYEDCNCVTRTEEYNCRTIDGGNGASYEECDTRDVEDCDRCPVYKTVQEAVYRDEPIYDWNTYYDIMRWKSFADVRTSGRDKNPEWGSDDRVKDPSTYRYGSRKEKYVLYFKEDDGTKHTEKLTETLTETKWSRINKGDKLVGSKSKFGVWYGIDWEK